MMTIVSDSETDNRCMTGSNDKNDYMCYKCDGKRRNNHNDV